MSCTNAGMRIDRRTILQLQSRIVAAVDRNEDSCVAPTQLARRNATIRKSLPAYLQQKSLLRIDRIGLSLRHETGGRNQLPRGATPLGRERQMAPIVLLRLFRADSDFNLAALQPADPIKCRTSTQRTQASQGVDSEEEPRP